MLWQDRQSGTITRKQEEEKELEDKGEGRKEGSADGQCFTKKVKRSYRGIHGRPPEHLGDQNPFCSYKDAGQRGRHRERDKRHKTLGKEGEDGSRSFSFRSLSEVFHRRRVSHLQSSWKEKWLKPGTAKTAARQCAVWWDRQEVGKRQTGVSSVQA